MHTRQIIKLNHQASTKQMQQEGCNKQGSTQQLTNKQVYIIYSMTTFTLATK